MTYGSNSGEQHILLLWILKPSFIPPEYN
jgi:hypothetical protein